MVGLDLKYLIAKLIFVFDRWIRFDRWIKSKVFNVCSKFRELRMLYATILVLKDGLDIFLNVCSKL